MPSHLPTNHSHNHLKITQHAFKALPSLSYFFRTLPCSQPYKASSGKALAEQHFSHSDLGTEEATLCRKQDKPLVFPLLGFQKKPTSHEQNSKKPYAKFS
jgi:hypothetical protein